MKRYVKNISMVLIALILFSVGSVNAQSNNYDYYGTIEATKRYFDSKNVTSYEELSEK